MYNFRSLSDKFHAIFFSLILHFTPQVMLFFVEKENPKLFSIQNCGGQRNQKILTFAKLYIASKTFGKVILKPFGKFEKTQVALVWQNRYQFYINFIAPLKIHFERFKSIRISLKSVFSAFRRKPSKSAPGAWNAQIQQAWQFLQASIFRQGLWSWLLFKKWRPFIHQQLIKTVISIPDNRGSFSWTYLSTILRYISRFFTSEN